MSRRARHGAYRAQAGILLRQTDILLALEDPQSAGKPGGTRETINRALSLGMPVLYLPLGEQRIALLRSIDDLEKDEHAKLWKKHLTTSIRTLLADPRSLSDAAGQSPSDNRELRERREYERQLLAEFFAAEIPAASIRPRLWSRFKLGSSTTPRPTEIQDPSAIQGLAHEGYCADRALCRAVSRTFLLAYGLAVLAVGLAAASQVVLIFYPQAHGAQDIPWWIFVAFGVCKLIVVVTILRIIQEANRNRWSEKSVDYRYLAERLAPMAYLPFAGSLWALPPGSGGYATRVGTQTVLDWLFQAMVRQVSLEAVIPAGGPGGRVEADLLAAVTAISNEWIANQLRYHARNADAMGRMSKGFEHAVRLMNLSVVWIVGLDLAVLLLAGVHLLPTGLSDRLLLLSPWFLFLSATLPAAVASANGVRFQSECARFADRSKQMKRMLSVLKTRADILSKEIEDDRAAPEARPGRSMDVLHLAEECTKLTLDEAAEWSFVYAKEIIEP